MTTPTSQELEAYVPVYDALPDKWEEARALLVERLKDLANGINAREIGFFLDEELLSGKQFIPGTTPPGNNPGIFRSVLRKVIDLGALAAGLNGGIAHGITFDANFTLIDLWVAGTNSITLTARDLSGNDVLMTATQIIVTSPQAFDRAFAFVEYIEEL